MPSRFAACVLVLAGCAFDRGGVAGDGAGRDATPTELDGSIAPDAEVAPDSAVPSGRFRKAITISADAIDANLTDFPVYVTLTDADLATHPTAVHFVAADGTTPLDHEVQAWDADTGHLEAWVRLPAISAEASTTFYLRYGAYASPPAEDPAGVWQNGFVAVWHLDDTPSSVASDVADSLGAHDATSTAMNASNRVDGTLGHALRFDGGTEQLAFTNPLTGASAHTISAWVDQDTVAHYSALVVIGTGACAQSRWLHARYIGGPVGAGFYCDDWATTNVDVQDDGWTLVHWVYGESKSRLYRDGASAAGPFTHLGTQSTAGTQGFIGNAPAAFGANMGLLGAVDEVRIANVARTPAWIAAEHANQVAPATFYAVGAEAEVP